MWILWDLSATLQVLLNRKNLLYQFASFTIDLLSCTRSPPHTLRLQQFPNMATESRVLTDVGFRQKMEEVYTKVCLTSFSWMLSSHTNLCTGRDNRFCHRTCCCLNRLSEARCSVPLSLLSRCYQRMTKWCPMGQVHWGSTRLH